MENKLKPSQSHCSQRKYVAEYKLINFSTLSIHQASKNDNTKTPTYDVISK